MKIKVHSEVVAMNIWIITVALIPAAVAYMHISSVTDFSQPVECHLSDIKRSVLFQ